LYITSEIGISHYCYCYKAKFIPQQRQQRLNNETTTTAAMHIEEPDKTAQTRWNCNVFRMLCNIYETLAISTCEL